MAAGDKHCKDRLVEDGAVPLLLEVTRCANVRAIVHAVQCLSSLAVVDQYKSTIGVQGGIEKLVRLLYMADYRLVVSAAHALASLSQNQHNKVRIYGAGGIERLVFHLRCLLDEHGGNDAEELFDSEAHFVTGENGAKLYGMIDPVTETLFNVSCVDQIDIKQCFVDKGALVELVRALAAVDQRTAGSTPVLIIYKYDVLRVLHSTVSCLANLSTFLTPRQLADIKIVQNIAALAGSETRGSTTAHFARLVREMPTPQQLLERTHGKTLERTSRAVRLVRNVTKKGKSGK